MRKIYLLLGCSLLLAATTRAQQVTENNFSRLRVHYSLPQAGLQPVPTDDKEYVALHLDGCSQGGELGKPSLPVSGSLLAVPFCDGMEVTVENAVYDTLPLEAGQVLPMQPSRWKDGRRDIPFLKDEPTYAADAFYALPLAEVEPLGVGRDRNYAQLRIAPVGVNPVSRQLVVCRSADITVSYRNADVARTAEVYSRYHTPAFSLGATLNELPLPKSVRTTAPVRMVILAGPTLQCDALEQFANWKREQGLMVDLIYTASNASATSLANQLKEMYTGATVDAPAPTYVLLVGDNAQLTAHQSKLSSNYWWEDYDHVTDLYYTTWTSGDILPDCYIGRFSATTVSSLTDIIDKTLYYERYQFEDDGYLTRAALISGVDGGYSSDYAYRYCDPTMDYVAYYYVNYNHGFSEVRYYKNNTSYAPQGVSVTGSSQSNGTAGVLKSYYNNGVGWINYSAHGDWNQWANPAFLVSDVNQMTNNGMPSFMIGNCCLTNKFEKDVCFGEALLRKGNRAGAVAYIGGTNFTTWEEDFFWGVGIRSNISNSMTPSYNASNMGIYDRLFHTHGEAIAEQAVTAGKMLMHGNMSVQNSSSTLKQYYWEIYELMGDPSLMPWLGRASELTASVRGASDELTVYVVPGAYVALVREADLSLVAAAYAGTDGVAHLVCDQADRDGCFVSITAQGYLPFRKSLESMGIGEADVAQVAVWPNPAVGSCEVQAEGLTQVELLNMVGQTLRTVRAADRCTLSLQGVPAGAYLLRLHTAAGISVRKLLVK